MSVYLDYNASAPIDLRVLDIMVEVYKNNIGNADSRTHNYGESARKVVENSRKQVASLLSVASDEVFFTSGATESNNIAIQGLREYAEKTNKKHIITTAIEHKAILETVKHLQKEGYEVDIVSPDISGRVKTDAILGKVREDTLLVSVMHVNNETGIIQPVKELGESLQEKNVLFHIDATQSCGKLVEEIKDLKYNMLSFSAHKLMGPQGVGVLILRKKAYKLPPVKAILYGGQQEHGIRPGTIPVALTAGCGKACEIAENEYKKNNVYMDVIKEKVLDLLNTFGVEYHINGDQEYCIGSTLNICIEGVSSEALMISTKQYCGLSNGSACTSKSYSPSYVLTAMGIPTSQIDSSIRISWGPDTSIDDVIENLGEVLEIAKQIRN
ncbi:cysteine desulfurase DndA [Clostridium beijerinckii]|uniref:Cysteine desulfurase DndA n=1 Tax=Clostridium beijerinckii TaxID=1520 RepID=A0A0B5QMM1_CLOBE|nr:aminotransferase class V-fold PLP-dependent enzyme [Clostridium beijerinckii]AJG99252.1 cysteine desulfurase DndA [Clostridium beijerinckii]